MNILDEYAIWLNHPSTDIDRIRNMGLTPWDVFKTQIIFSGFKKMMPEKQVETTKITTEEKGEVNVKARTSTRSKKGK